jgi:hypothetical protein
VERKAHSGARTCSGWPDPRRGERPNNGQLDLRGRSARLLV